MPDFSTQSKKSIHRYWVAFALILMSLLVAWLDISSDLGRSYWVLHFPLIIGSVLLPVSWLPAALTAIAVGGNVVGYFYSPVGVDPSLAWINRGLGVVSSIVIGIVATAGRRFQERMKHQTQVKRVQAEMTNVVNRKENLSQLADDVLVWLEESVELLAGSMYVRDGAEHLKLVGQIGWGGKADFPSSFSFGEGLVGKCAVRKKTQVLSEIPDNYFYYSLSSSLGQMKPAHLVIWPLVHEDRCWGVIELALRRPPTPVLLDFLDETSHQLGVAVRGIMDAQRLQELLEESQAQAEELQTQAEELKTQQEELRTANDELEEHARALEDSQSKLEEQQAELENSNEQLRLQRNAMMEANQRLRETEENLRQQSEELEKASQYKSEFLANMSHELRTPLNSILILSRLLYEDKAERLDDEQIEFARTIESAGNDLLELINDILDHSRIESGKMEVIPEQYSLNGLVRRIQSQIAPTADKKGLKFLVETSKDVPSHIYGDQKMTLQILKNFLSNALKFTEEGEVRLAVSRPASSEWKSSQPALKFSVIDTGIGIEKENLEAVFEAFRQADGTTRRKYGGTGLGLSICRNLARVLEGDIQVDSEVGKGSVFSLIIPECPSYWQEAKDSQSQTVAQNVTSFEVERMPRAKPAASSEGEATEQVTFADDRSDVTDKDQVILVVEDDRNFARYLLERARNRGFKVLVALDGEEGLSLARQYNPSAVMLDVRLPTRSGLSVLEQMKSDSRTRHIPIYIISAIDYSKNSLQLGAVGYLQKPVSEPDLDMAFARINEFLNRKTKKVLVIEDNDLQRRMICELVGDINVETVAVASGNEALKAIEDTQFDCVVLDLRLPDMTGADLLERLSHSHIMPRPPVIVYTGKELEREEEEELRRHSDSIILKGARSPERLLDETSLFLHRIESELNEERREMLEQLRDRDKRFEDRRIMVVDDDMRNIFALSSVIEGKGAEVIVARNGREALQQVQSQDKIDLVLMDIMMPEMDGIEAIQHIRNGDGGKHRQVPIIALTAKAMKGDQEKCLSAGANDYLAKPVETDQLMSLMRVWMNAGAQWGAH